MMNAFFSFFLSVIMYINEHRNTVRMLWQEIWVLSDANVHRNMLSFFAQRTEAYV